MISVYFLALFILVVHVCSTSCLPVQESMRLSRTVYDLRFVIVRLQFESSCSWYRNAVDFINLVCSILWNIKNLLKVTFHRRVEHTNGILSSWLVMHFYEKFEFYYGHLTKWLRHNWANSIIVWWKKSCFVSVYRVYKFSGVFKGLVYINST